MSKDGQENKEGGIFGAMNKIGDSATENYFSMFPEELIASILDAFIINRPMTAGVGGDGFWIHQGDDSLYVVVFDCMGHGHLASMMTRQYTRSLEKVVVDKGYGDPGFILAELHKEIQTKFEGKKNLKVGSGADVGIVKIGTTMKSIEYAGAKMELTYVVDGKIEKIKPTRMQIGDLFDYEHKYKTIDVPINEGKKTNFYLASDGFRDLGGGGKGKKLGNEKVTELLEGVYKMPMSRQKQVVDHYLDEWSKYFKPLDDVLIVGFSL